MELRLLMRGNLTFLTRAYNGTIHNGRYRPENVYCPEQDRWISLMVRRIRHAHPSRAQAYAPPLKAVGVCFLIVVWRCYEGYSRRVPLCAPVRPRPRLELAS